MLDQGVRAMLDWVVEHLESIFFVMFLVGFLFTIISAIFSGAFESDFGAGSSFDGGMDPGAMGGDISGIDGVGTPEVGWTQHPVPGFSPLSPTVVSAFAMTAGGIGYLAVSEWEMQALNASAVAVAAGLAVASIVFFIFSALYKAATGTSQVIVASLVGSEAEVTSPIPERGMGEIAFISRGRRLNSPAQTADSASVPQGAKVVIKDVSSAVYVVEETRESWLARSREAGAQSGG